MRLFCFPYAGTGASVFFPWADLVPAAVDLCPVQLPGREMRLREVPFSRLEPLVVSLAEAIAPLLTMPYAFFGHSMGALIAFELLRHLRHEGFAEPAVLFVSAFNAPDLPNPNPPIHGLSDDEFLASVQRLYHGIPREVLDEPELMRLVLPVLRADFALMETYAFQPEKPVSTSIVCFGGDRDVHVDSRGLSAWRRHTWGRFSLEMLPGDHFFLKSARGLLVQTLTHWILPYLG